MSFNDLPTGEERRSPFRSVGFLAAAGFIALVVVLGVALVVADGSGGHAVVSTTSPSSTAPTAAGSAAPPVEATCSPKDAGQTVPTTTPDNISWSLHNGLALPASTTAGPEKVDGALASCYAHTPLGALMAASVIDGRYSVASAADALSILKNQVLPGPGRDKALQYYASGQGNDNSVQGQYAAFQFVTYSSDVAVIDLVLHMDNDTYNSAAFTVRWSGGDWKLQLQDSGQDSSNVSQIPGISGYVPWSGVS